MGKLWRVAAVAACMAATLLLLVVSPAGAHAGVESSDPTAGAVIDDPVSEITLVFSDQTEPIGDGFQVVESDGEIRAPNEWRSPDGRTFVLRFDPPITGGETGLHWTIRSGDSHALNGELSFTVDAEKPVVPVPEADAEPSVEVSSDIGPSSREVTAPRPANEPEQAAARSVVEKRPTIESVPVLADVDPGVLDVEVNGSAAMRTLGLLGRLATMAGSLVAVGALLFLILVLRGTLGEGRLVMAVARRAAIVIVAGVVAESVAHVVIQGGVWASMLSPVEWTGVLTSRFGGGAALHLIGAFGLWTGSHFRREPLGARRSDVIRADMTRVGVLAAGHRSSAVANHPPLHSPAEVGASLTPLLFRWHPNSASSGAVLGVVALLAAAVVDGHSLGGTVTLLSIVATLAHVLAGSVWVGGVIVLFLVLRRRLAAQRRVEAVDVAVRYSVLAALSLVGVALAGLILTYNHLDSISQLWTTAWGRLILAKLALVAVAASLGAVNHFVVIPRLVTRSDDIGLGAVLKRLVSVEVVVLVTVLAVTAQLVTTGP